MTWLRRLLCTPLVTNRSAASILCSVLTTVGVVTFLAGVFYLPSLQPTRVEMILTLLLLAAVALLCTAVGQLAVVMEQLGRRDKGR